MNLISIDAHKASFTFAVFQGGDLVAGPSRRPNVEKSVRELTRRYPGFLIVVEACGVHEWMCDVWLQEGAEVFVAKPFKTEKREKSDGKDTLRLGRRYLSGELKQVMHFPAELRLLRSLTRERSFLVAQRTQLINHVRHELNRWNLSHLDLDDEEEICRLLPHLRSGLTLIKTVHELTKPLEQLMRTKSQHLSVVEHLKSIPGFGEVVSLAFYAEVGDIERFPTAESLVKYIGVDPVWSQSGDTLTDAHRISKAGNSRLRSLLVQASWVHVRFCKESPITHKYNRLTQRGKPKPVAIMAVERHLIELAWRLWKDKRDFTIIRPATTSS